MSNLIGLLAGNILLYCTGGYYLVWVVMDTSDHKKSFQDQGLAYETVGS